MSYIASFCSTVKYYLDVNNSSHIGDLHVKLPFKRQLKADKAVAALAEPLIGPLVPPAPAPTPQVQLPVSIVRPQYLFALHIMRNDPQAAYQIFDQCVKNMPHKRVLMTRAARYLHQIQSALLPHQIRAPILTARSYITGDQLTQQVRSHKTILAALERALNPRPKTEEEHIEVLVGRARMEQDAVAYFKLFQVCLRNPHKQIKLDPLLQKIQDGVTFVGEIYSWKLARRLLLEADHFGLPAAAQVLLITGYDERYPQQSEACFISQIYRYAFMNMDPRNNLKVNQIYLS